MSRPHRPQRHLGDLLQRPTLSVPACRTVTRRVHGSGGNACAQPLRDSVPVLRPRPFTFTLSLSFTWHLRRYSRPRLRLRPTGTQGSAGTVTVAAANGTFDGTPHNARCVTARPERETTNGATNFDLYVRAREPVSATQPRSECRDFTGNGSWDRLETYNYFPTDP